MVDRRDILKLAGASAVSASGIALPLSAAAQSFPARPIRYICPWPAGGSTDAVMRSIAESASKAIGGTIIVDNKPGAGGMLGANELVNAKPDGNTLSQLPHGVFRIPHMQKTAWNPVNAGACVPRAGWKRSRPARRPVCR